jgi:hypothetical protein
VDSGTTGHYLLLDSPCTEKTITIQPLRVMLPNGETIASTHMAKLPFPQLPETVLQAHIFPQLRNQALLSVGVLCDAGCTVTFEATAVKIRYNNQVVLEGTHVPPGLWTTTVTQQQPQANASYSAPLKATALQHLHASLFSPATQTWVKAIANNHFTTWPSFTVQEVSKYLPKSTATTMGHLDQQRKNLRSTKRKPKVATMEDTDGINDSNPASETATHTGYANLVEVSDPSLKSYSDLTGRFPVHSSQGNLYVLVVYLYDANAILVQPLKNRSEGEQIKAYETIVNRIPTHLQPKVHWMDNEASTALKRSLVEKYGIDYQLVPPHIHRRNAAERAIRTFKNHFIAGLCSTHPDFPLRLWDELLPQAEISLNLLRASRTQPNISAYQAVFGTFDYNRHPLMPPGTKVIVHEKPGQRGSWDPHGKLGWYLGPALEHYRCHWCHIISTNNERIADTVEFFPHIEAIQKLSPQEATIIAAEALSEALKRKKPPTNLSTLLEPTKAALQQLQQYIHPKPTVEANTESSPRVRAPPRERNPSNEPATTTPTCEPIARRTRSGTHCTNQNAIPNFYANAVAQQQRKIGNFLQPMKSDDWPKALVDVSKVLTP